MCVCVFGMRLQGLDSEVHIVWIGPMGTNSGLLQDVVGVANKFIRLCSNHLVFKAPTLPLRVNQALTSPEL